MTADPDPDDPGTYGLRITKRRFMALLGGGAAVGSALAVDDDGDTGTLWSGTMALSQAYKVASGERDWYQGPDSAKGSISGQNGDRYSATDTQIEYYWDGGWTALGMGSSGTKAPPSHFQSLSTESLNNVRYADQFGGTGADQIQNAIDDLPASGGTVIVPEGTYEVSGTDETPSDSIVPASDVTIMGVGEATVIKIADQTQLNAFEFSGKSNVRITNLKIDGNKSNQDSADFKKNGTASDEEQWLNGIKAENCTNVVVDNCHLVDLPNNGVQFYYGTSKSTVHNCLIEDCEWWSIQFWDAQAGGESSPATRVTEYNKAIANTIADTNVSAGGGMALEFDEVRRCVVANNVVLDTNGNGIQARGRNNVVSGNVLDNCGTGGNEGIKVTNGNRIVVSANNIQNAGDDGIFIDGRVGTTDRCLIVGNLIRNSSTSGIYLIQTTECIVSLNHITDAQNAAIQLDDADVNQVICNSLVDSSGSFGDGIRLKSGAEDNEMAFNLIKDNSQAGVNFDASGDDNNRLIQNHITGNTGSSVSDSGSGNEKIQNKGYVTEASGEESFTGDGSTSSFTIAHGMDETPTTVVLTQKAVTTGGEDIEDYDVDGTNITVNFTANLANTETGTVGWMAEAR